MVTKGGRFLFIHVLLAILDDDTLVVITYLDTIEVIDVATLWFVVCHHLDTGWVEFQGYFVDVAVGTIDGNAHNLLTCFEVSADVALKCLVGVPTVVGGLRYVHLAEADDAAVLDKTQCEARAGGT